MVSFCDLPLSRISEHFDKYGSFAIGMSKEWALKKKLCPVQYVTSGSHYQLSLFRILATKLDDTLAKHSGYVKYDQKNPHELSYIDVLRYMKPYRGDLVRAKVTKKNYVFYDECEWRYVPPHGPDFTPITEEKVYRKKKQALNNKVAHLQLDFDFSDIQYLIVPQEEDADYFREIISSKLRGRLEEKELLRLASKIITDDQMRQDI